jgi:hypothetical protein
MERFLGLTEDEINKNEKLWREENGKTDAEEPKGSDLRSIGVSVGDVEADESSAEQMETPPEGEEGAESPEVAGPVTSAAPGSAPTAAAGAATPASPPV